MKRSVVFLIFALAAMLSGPELQAHFHRKRVPPRVLEPARPAPTPADSQIQPHSRRKREQTRALEASAPAAHPAMRRFLETRIARDEAIEAATTCAAGSTAGAVMVGQTSAEARVAELEAEGRRILAERTAAAHRARFPPPPPAPPPPKNRVINNADLTED